MGKFKDIIVPSAIDFGFGAVGSGFSSALSMATAKRNADIQYQYNKKLADDAYQRDIDFWNMQNAYNSPAAQVSRLRQAGLNPALLNGGIQGNTAGDLSSTPQASIGMPAGTKVDNPVTSLGVVAQMSKTLSDADLVDEQTKYWMQETANSFLENILQQLNGKDQWLRIKDSAKTMGFEIPDSDKYDELFGVGARSADGVSPSQTAEDVARQQIAESSARMDQLLSDTLKTLNDIKNDNIRLDFDVQMGTKEYELEVQKFAQQKVVDYYQIAYLRAQQLHIDSQTAAQEYMNTYILPMQQRVMASQEALNLSQADVAKIQEAYTKLQKDVQTGDAQGFVTYVNHYINNICGIIGRGLDLVL